MNADFQLRHSTVSRHGSFWGTKTDVKTRGMLRELSRAAAAASRLQHIDAGGAYAIGAQKMLMEDVNIMFLDGHFAVTGPDMQSYVPVEVSAGVYEMSRDNTAVGNSGYVPRAHKLSDLSAAEVAEMVADVPTLLSPGSWFLIPKPPHINPIALSTRKAGVDLAYGIDFFTSKHFIITQLPPAEYFTPGAIIATVAEVTLESFDAYASDSPRNKKGRKWVNTYAKRAQSMELFRRAAAEFCGLYVLPTDDVVLNVVELPDGAYAYAFANAGVITVDYAHTPLVPGTPLPAGYVVCDRFEIISRDSFGGPGFLTSSGNPIDLTGLFGVPVFLPADGVIFYSYYYVGPSLKTHLQFYYAGAQDDLELVWVTQMIHELRTGNYLSEVFGYDDPEDFPVDAPDVNAAALIETFYGRRLHLLVTEGLPEAFKFEFSRFLREYTPVGTIVLVADGDTPLPPVLPPVPPPEGNIYYAGSHLHYETATLSYEE